MSYHFQSACLLVFSSLLLAGCSSPERNMLIGKWQIKKPDKILKRIDNADTQSVDTNTVSPQGSGQMVLRFWFSGKLETNTKMWDEDYKKEGTWQLLGFDSKKRESLVLCVLNGQTTEHRVEWLENGNLKMVPPNMAGTKTKLEFERAD